MSLILGIIAGLSFGLSAFAGAFMVIPLLVVGAGIEFHASLPVALLALGICAAVAAGDAVRARQCDVVLATCYLVGALPATVAGAFIVQALSDKLLATVFLICAIAFGPLLVRTVQRFRFRLLPSPASLLHAPRRDWSTVGNANYNRQAKRRITIAAAGCGVLCAFCAAPGSWLGGRALDRELPGQPFNAAGTLVFAVSVLCIVGSAVQFLLAPAAPGYTAGLFVLGSVAGMGLARRIEPRAWVRYSNELIGGLVMAGALVLWLAVVADWVGSR
ncbi:sulfite exporter TauE/SafE family protein [Salinisphaera sp. T31B1]|uniref:sulfite exporter TauE/SafE family protein n=1 Tax=Salinisphaera sp. T31B1 TaxID=727963 RepID=UPI0033420924